MRVYKDHLYGFDEGDLRCLDFRTGKIVWKHKDRTFRKGSLLDYDGVYLAEGQWPAKAYFDAMRQARKRDAALFMDYGYTRPNVVSQGPIRQGC